MFQSNDENSFTLLAGISNMATRGCIPILSTFIPIARMLLKFEKLHIFDIQVVRTIMNNLLEYPNGDLQ
jgi:hypothetical protein